MGCFVLTFDEIDQSQVAVVGGKGAHLGELSRIEGIRVPPGFCLTTNAFRRAISEAGGNGDLLDRMAHLEHGDREAIRALSAEMRATIEAATIPGDVVAEVIGALPRIGEASAYAVRSSATAEDLPTASFAGQQDTYLNVTGREAILDLVRKCWASLFTERAVTYRLRNGIDHRAVRMAVVVQRMVFPEASGVLFTADPLTGNRKVTSVEAIFGLGEALVSGMVTADVYTVRDGAVVSTAIAAKRRATVASPSGGTQEQAVAPERQNEPALTDAQVIRLAELGRRIEAHFGRPQDIEWCLVDGEFQIVQSRPITTLFPVPERDDDAIHVYLSVGHQQMMTDPMKPLGISVWQLTAGRPMFTAGGRLFVDVTAALATPPGRAGLMAMAGKSDPLTGDALRTIIERGDIVPPRPDDAPGAPPAPAASPAIETDPALVTGLIERDQASIAAATRDIRTTSGSELLDFILADLHELKRVLFDPLSLQAIMAGIEAAWWLNEQLESWLGEKNAADTLTQSVPGNVTSEMGLALLEVADAIRPFPAVVTFLEKVSGDDFLDELPEIEGGRESRDAILGWLETYGMRCAGEIDITRPRWSERPTSLVPLILGNVRNSAAGEGRRRFEQGRQQALAKEQELLERLRELPDGAQKAAETKRMIDRVRTFAGYREYPKYGMISRYFVYKQALLAEAARLVQAGVLLERDDIYYLTFQELQEVVRRGRADDHLIRRRKDESRSYQTLTPPRVLTSDGEVFTGSYRRDDVPPAALIGVPVSSGTVEGRARVILDMAETDLNPGDILVTAYTDPSWTPLFVTIAGLVTEVGGLMTHGAVIAREYGLPAVVAVPDATRLIQDGQRIRVHGTDGYIELLS
jgi:pyruvate,water dikinase